MFHAGLAERCRNLSKGANPVNDLAQKAGEM